MTAGALLAGGAVFSLLMALAPGRGDRGRSRALEFIRASTLEAQPSARGRSALPRALLRRFSQRLGLGARWITRQQLVEAGIDPDVFPPEEATALKLLLALLAGAASLVAAAALPGSLALAPVAAWAAFVAPNAYLGRRRARRKAAVMAELPDLVGLLRAFINAQVTLEQALHLISAQLSRSDPGNVLARELQLALGAYGLGLTIEESLGAMAERVGVDELRTLVAAIAQGKRLGAGMELILRDQELLVRMSQRNRATAAASRVSTRLMAVLVAVYLPEFVILVMLPLFWGVMLRAFG